VYDEIQEPGKENQEEIDSYYETSCRRSCLITTVRDPARPKFMVEQIVVIALGKTI
jgi:hypothetical protein